jgi:hypothetical protein
VPARQYCGTSHEPSFAYGQGSESAVGAAVSSGGCGGTDVTAAATSGEEAPSLAHAIAQIAAFVALAHAARHLPHGGSELISPATAEAAEVALPAPITRMTVSIVHTAALVAFPSLSFAGLPIGSGSTFGCGLDGMTGTIGDSDGAGGATASGD